MLAYGSSQHTLMVAWPTRIILVVSYIGPYLAGCLLRSLISYRTNPPDTEVPHRSRSSGRVKESGYSRVARKHKGAKKSESLLDATRQEARDVPSFCRYWWPCRWLLWPSAYALGTVSRHTQSSDAPRPPYAFRAGLKKQPLNNCMSEGKNNAAEPAALQLTPGRADLV